MSIPRYARDLPGYVSVEKAMAEHRAIVADAMRFRWLIGNSGGQLCHPDAGPNVMEIKFPSLFFDKTAAMTWGECVRDAIDNAIGIDEATRKGMAEDEGATTR